MSLEALLKHPLLAMQPHDSCAEAARQMRIEGVGSVVVAEDQRPLGMVTDRDLVVRVMANGLDPERVPLREVMSGEPIYLSVRRPVDELIKTMKEYSVRRVPIVDEHGKLIGIVSLDDVLLWCTDQLSQLAEVAHHATQTT